MPWLYALFTLCDRTISVRARFCSADAGCMDLRLTAQSYYAQYTAPTRLNSTVESSRVGGVYWIRNQFTTDLVDKLKNEHVENLSSRVGCRTGNWVTTADGYTSPDTTQFDSKCSAFNFSIKSVGSRRELVANSIHTARRRRDSAGQLSSVSELVVCIGLYHVLRITISAARNASLVI